MTQGTLQPLRWMGISAALSKAAVAIFYRLRSMRLRGFYRLVSRRPFIAPAGVVVPARSSDDQNTPNIANNRARTTALDDRTQSRQLHHAVSRFGPLKRETTALVKFEEAPFPYDGAVPDSNVPFLDVSSGAERGHRTAVGAILWEKGTFDDSRTLLHLPKGFDANRPGIIVVFFHGHGAKLERDVTQAAAGARTDLGVGRQCSSRRSTVRLGRRGFQCGQVLAARRLWTFPRRSSRQACAPPWRSRSSRRNSPACRSCS